MKKALILLTVVIVFLTTIMVVAIPKVYADQETNLVDEVTKEPQGNLIKIKEQQAKTLEEYKVKYGSDSYGFTAYILHIVQIYSIPFCFLGIVISIIYKVVIGARHLENLEKGLGMMVAIVTVTIICQVLPLVFAIVVKVGRE